MFKFLRQFSKLFVVASIASFYVNAEKTMDFYSKEANVFFDIKKIRGGLELIGKECGVEMFHTKIQDFSKFNELCDGTFQIQRLQDELHWRYFSDNDEFFEIAVRQNGDVSLCDLPQNYSGFDRYKTYAFRTPGTLENRGSQAFYNLVLIDTKHTLLGLLGRWKIEEVRLFITSF